MPQVCQGSGQKGKGMSLKALRSRLRDPIPDHYDAARLYIIEAKAKIQVAIDTDGLPQLEAAKLGLRLAELELELGKLEAQKNTVVILGMIDRNLIMIREALVGQIIKDQASHNPGRKPGKG